MSVVQWFLNFVNHGGYLGVFIMTMIESTSLPIIMPAEVVLLTVGYSTVNGSMNIFNATLVATIGSIAGGLINYFIAKYLGRSFLYKYGKYIFLSTHRLQLLEKSFKKHAAITTFSSRFMPFIKHIGSLPAGLCEMPKLQFIYWHGLGSLIFSGIMIVLGAYIGNNTSFLQKRSYLIPVCMFIFAVISILLYYMYNKMFLNDTKYND